MFKVATVCTGIGSPEMALRNLGISHEIVFGCEIDKYARQTYLANFNPGFMVPDMTQCDWIGEQYYSDLFIGGIPCQAFSLAGKRLGELDPRGLLFFDFYRYVKNQKPKYFIIENVKGLLSDNAGATFQNWINLLGQSVNGDPFMFPHEDSLMYNLHWQVLNTKDYGLPHNRERVFLIGIRNNLPNSFVFPKGVPLKLRLKDILEPEVDEKYYLSDETIDKVLNSNFNQEKSRFQEKDICDTLLSRDYKDPKCVRVNSATKSGYEIATEVNQRIAGWFENENVIGAYRDDAKRSSVSEHIYQKENSVCNTIQCAHVPKVIQGGEWRVASDDIKIGAMRGRNPENHSDRTAGAPTQQMLEINENGTSNCLTSVQKDNLVIQINPSLESGGVQPYQQNRIYDSEGISPALCRGKSDLNVTENEYRIRKLTPKECFRLQGFPDEFLQNAIDAGVSNSQLYKQAGNSISVPVIQAIFKNLLTQKQQNLMKVSELKIDQTIEINGHQYQYKGVTKERIPGIGYHQVILFEGVSKGSAPRKTFALTVGNKDLKIHDDGKIEFK